MLKIVKKFPTIQVFGRPQLGELPLSEEIELHPSATHFFAGGSCYASSGQLRLRLASGSQEHKVSREILDLSAPGFSRTGLLPLEGRFVRVSLDGGGYGRHVLGKVELTPVAATGDPDKPSCRFEPEVSPEICVERFRLLNAFYAGMRIRAGQEDWSIAIRDCGPRKNIGIDFEVAGPTGHSAAFFLEGAFNLDTDLCWTHQGEIEVPAGSRRLVRICDADFEYFILRTVNRGPEDVFVAAGFYDLTRPEGAAR